MSYRQTVKDFVSQWSDEKLAQVFAFNQDGKMEYTDPCSCLIGVHSSKTLHRMTDMLERKFLGIIPFPARFCDSWHYVKTKKRDDRFAEAESAYCALGFGDSWLADRALLRRQIFGEILSEVMAERATTKNTTTAVPQLVG